MSFRLGSKVNSSLWNFTSWGWLVTSEISRHTIYVNRLTKYNIQRSLKPPVSQTNLCSISRPRVQLSSIWFPMAYVFFNACPLWLPFWHIASLRSCTTSWPPWTCSRALSRMMWYSNDDRDLPPHTSVGPSGAISDHPLAFWQALGGSQSHWPHS